MPHSDHPVQELTEPVGPLKCEVELPSSWAGFFDRRGLMPTCPRDRRRFPRSYFRGSAALQYRQSFPALPRPATWYKVYTKDVSRGGVSFLHSEQLFPGEQMSLILPDDRSRSIEVIRCRRIQQRCFEIGAIFTAALHNPPAADTKPGDQSP